MALDRIRNFSIIAHIDHGKSTLADRLLEVTKTIETRRMREQFLDMMDLERERGITIKMQPVRLLWSHGGSEYLLNLIDTPGHIDFSYEVSRALKAVEGVILLVDASQGVQAQTLSVLEMARNEGLTIIPVMNKIDLPAARPDDVRDELVDLLGCDPGDILAVSGKTGEGVDHLLEKIIDKVPPPKEIPSMSQPNDKRCQALVFDFEYSTHRGVIVFARLFDGELKAGDQAFFIGSREKFPVQEVGVFAPEKKVTAKLESGQIGYIVTGLKKPGEAKVGDTITLVNHQSPAVPGYEVPRPVVWASLYPESQDDFNLLKLALERLRLSDSSLSFEEETSGILGRGFRCGFLGMLHLEIITERLKREHNLSLVVASPTISYRLINERSKQEEIIYSPLQFPEETKNYKIFERYIDATIITPAEYLSALMPLFHEHETAIVSTEVFRDGRTRLTLRLPLRELMRGFFDEIKSASSGFASLSYQLADEAVADVVRLDVLINEELVPAFSRITSRRRVEREGRELVERLRDLLPKQLITIKIQAKALGRIIAAKSISALRKDVTDYLYGGDITRKMKLREKQKKGKKKMQAFGKVNIPHDVFLKVMRSKKE